MPLGVRGCRKDLNEYVTHDAADDDGWLLLGNAQEGEIVDGAAGGEASAGAAAVVELAAVEGEATAYQHRYTSAYLRATALAF